jgi:putative ABC transport system ATP-binding protein
MGRGADRFGCCQWTYVFWKPDKRASVVSLPSNERDRASPCDEGAAGVKFLQTPTKTDDITPSDQHSMDLVIEARHLTKIYDEGVQVHALRGVDLQISRGSFVAIMGPSGSGKSTLLNILGALEVPTAGELLIDGQAVGALADDERTLFRRRRIGFVFQQFNLLPVFSAVENVAVPLRLEGVRPAEARRRALEMLGLVGLAERGDHLPSQLSGGEQQRVAVARALIAGPAIILADEPTGNLDSANGDIVIGILRDLVDRHGQTVVLVTHDATVAARSDRVVGVRDGQVVGDHPPHDAALAAAGSEPRP